MKTPTVRILAISLATTLLGGCASKQSISASAIDAPLRGVLSRHDAYVRADAKLSPTEKEVYLRSSLLVGTALDTALSSAPTKTTIIDSSPTPK